MSTSSAVPATLVAYADQTRSDDVALHRAATRTADAVQVFVRTSPDHTALSSDVAHDAAAFAVRNGEVDGWVGRVGSRFLLADGGSLFCSIPPRVVTVDDAVLVAAGFPSRWQAANAGRAFADEVLGSLSSGDEIDPAVLERWRDEMIVHNGDAAFTVAFFEKVGVDSTRRLVAAIENNWPRERWGEPRWGLDVLSPFSEALATAMDTRRLLADRNEVRHPENVTMPDRYRLDESFVDGLLEIPYSYDYDEPQEHHVALLFARGVFPTDVLLRLAEQVVLPRLANHTEGARLSITPWAWEVDPVANVFGAISRNRDASLAFVETDEDWLEHDHLRMMLERWAEIDGDGGRNGAAVLRQAFTHPDRDRAAALFERAMRDIADIGEIRNYFAFNAFADGAASHIDRIATTAATEGDRESLVATHAFLAHVLSDTEAAATIFDAAIGHTGETFERADEGDALGSEVWQVGALLALVLSADTTADVRSAEERIARRDGMLDGIGQITDLGLTLTRGRWIPFVRAGRDALLDSFRNTDELDEALSEMGEVRDQYRLRMSELIAARLVSNGVLDPKPAAASLETWLNSDEVRDAITDLRAQAGQSFDEVFDVLEAER